MAPTGREREGRGRAETYGDGAGKERGGERERPETEVSVGSGEVGGADRRDRCRNERGLVSSNSCEDPRTRRNVLVGRGGRLDVRSESGGGGGRGERNSGCEHRGGRRPRTWDMRDSGWELGIDRGAGGEEGGPRFGELICWVGESEPRGTRDGSEGRKIGTLSKWSGDSIHVTTGTSASVGGTVVTTTGEGIDRASCFAVKRC